MRGAVAVGLALGGCGGVVIVVAPDASPDAGAIDSGVDGSVVDAGDELNLDRDAWFSRFDARFFEGLEPPVVGSFPPVGPEPCYQSGCGGTGQCGDFTGWCCSGEFKKGSCRCGYTLGCLPPELCCGLPDAYVPRCTSTASDCYAQDGKAPW